MPTTRPRRTATRPKVAKAVASRGPVVRMHVDTRRAHLLALGLEIFSKESYDAVSIDELARAAGISKGLLYHYFPTKRAFYVAALREAARQLLEKTDAPADTPPLDRLRIGVDAYLRYVVGYGATYTALLRGGIGSDADVAGIVQQVRGDFLGRLLAGMRIANPAPLTRAALWGWIGFVEAASLDWVERQDIDQSALGDLLIAVLTSTLAGAAAREAAEGLALPGGVISLSGLSSAVARTVRGSIRDIFVL